jgi:hypothetical protein
VSSTTTGFGGGCAILLSKHWATNETHKNFQSISQIYTILYVKTLWAQPTKDFCCLIWTTKGGECYLFIKWGQIMTQKKCDFIRQKWRLLTSFDFFDAHNNEGCSSNDRRITKCCDFISLWVRQVEILSQAKLLPLVAHVVPISFYFAHSQLFFHIYGCHIATGFCTVLYTKYMYRYIRHPLGHRRCNCTVLESYDSTTLPRARVLPVVNPVKYSSRVPYDVRGSFGWCLTHYTVLQYST